MNCRKYISILFNCILLPFKLIGFLLFWLTLFLIPCLKHLPCRLCLRMGFGSKDQRIHPMLGHAKPGYNFGPTACCSLFLQIIRASCGWPLMEGDKCVDFDLYDMRTNSVWELRVEDNTVKNDSPSSTTASDGTTSKELAGTSSTVHVVGSVSEESIHIPSAGVPDSGAAAATHRIQVLNFGSATSAAFLLESGKFIHLASKYRLVADFSFVYIDESHPSDGWWRLSDNVNIARHIEFEDRLAASKIFQDSLFSMEFIDLDLNMQTALNGIGFLVDDMTNFAAQLFGAYPYRCVVLKNDHVVAVSGLGHLGYDLSPIENYLHGEFEKQKHRISRSESSGHVPFALDIR